MSGIAPLKREFPAKSAGCCVVETTQKITPEKKRFHPLFAMHA
jgi:hypothetical protein